MTPRVFFYLLIFCVNIPATAFSQRATDIADTLQRLRQIKIEDDRETDVPAAVIPLLTRLKHDLLASFQQVLNEGGPGVQATAAQEELLRRLRATGVGAHEIDWNDPQGYGFISHLEVRQPSGHSDLLMFRSELSIECGDDSSLYVFKKSEGRWKVMIAVESNGYKKISGGLGNLLYYDVSPPDADGRWFLVYAHQEPWCTSNWNYIHYRVLRTGGTPEKPVVVLSREDEMYRGGVYRGGDLPRLEVTKDSFRLEFEGNQKLDSGVFARTHVACYRIASKRATRIPPLASSAAGFLDEWAHMPWRDAERWSRSPELARAGHDTLGTNDEYHEFDFVQPCPGGNKWQIGVKLSEFAQHGPDRKLIATIVKEGESYFVAQIGDKRPGGCPGNRQVFGDE
jgi:hypothetical protein